VENRKAEISWGVLVQHGQDVPARAAATERPAIVRRMKMDPVNGATGAITLQAELHKVIETFGVEFEEMMTNQMQTVFNNANQAMQEEENS
jgi:hypothetical protein